MQARRRRNLFALARQERERSEAPRRAVLYGRYSSVMQSDGWTLEAQESDLRRYCELHGWTVVYWDADEATSGRKGTDRPGFDRCMAAIADGRGNVFVAHKIDRFGRSMVEILNNVERLHDMGAGLVCTQQFIDTTNPISGKVTLAVLAALAEVYVDNLSEETVKGKRARSSAGLPVGDPPFGYLNPDWGTPASGPGRKNRTVAVIVPERAAAVRRAFELYASGRFSYAQVAAALNVEFGPIMVSKQRPEPHPFTRDGLVGMLQNPYYAGWVTHVGGEFKRRHGRTATHEGKHEPLIDRDLFARVQAVRSRRHGHPTSTERHAHVYLAAGLVCCTACRQPMRVNRSGGGYVRYVDEAPARGIPCGATRRTVAGKVVDSAVAAAVAYLRLPEDWRELVLSGLEGGESGAVRVEERRAQLARELDRAQQFLLRGLVTEPQFLARRAEIEAELASLQAPARGGVDLERAAALLADLPELWAGQDEDGRAALAHDLFAAIWVDLDQRRVVEVALHADLAGLKLALVRSVGPLGFEPRTAGL